MFYLQREAETLGVFSELDDADAYAEDGDRVRYSEDGVRFCEICRIDWDEVLS